MADFATLVLGAETKGLKQAEPALDSLVVKAGQAEGAAKKLTTATKGMGDSARASTAGLKQASAALQEVGQEARTAETMLESTDRALDAVGTRSGMASNSARMVAQQLSQVAQQASATGNFTQALAIQLPDMAMGFGAWGIAAGIVASVALPALVQMLGTTIDKQEQMKETTEALQAATEAYLASVEAQGAAIDVLGEKYGALAMVAAEATRAQTEAAQAEAIRLLAERADQLANSLGNLEGRALTTARGTTYSYIESFMALRNEFGLTEAAASKVYSKLRDLAAAEGPQATADAARALRDELESAFGSAAKMPEPIRNLYDELNAAVLEAAALQGGLDEASGAADAVERAAAQINSTLASADGSALQAAFSGAFPLANQLLGMAQGIVATLNAARAGVNTAEANAFAITQGGQALVKYGGRTPNAAQADLAARNAPVIPTFSGGGGGGGGRSAAAAEAEKEAEAIQKVIDKLKSEVEQVGMTAEARRLHQELQKAGVDIYSKEGQQIAALVEQLTELEAKQKLVAETMKGIENAAQGFFVGVLSGAKDLKSAIGDLLRDLGNLFLNQAFKMLWGGAAAGGKGKGLGGLIAGLFDAGGRIAAGQVGLVAEKRPEVVDGELITRPTLVRGPAKVTGGAETARMMGVPRPQMESAPMRRQQAMPAPRVTVQPPPVVVLDDPRKIDAFQRSPQGERVAAWQRRRMGNG